MTLDDLKHYAAIEREPVSRHLSRPQHYRLHATAHPPAASTSSSSSTSWKAFRSPSQGANSAASIHDMAEAMKLAYADRAEYLGDPAVVNVPVKGLTSKTYAAKLREMIEPGRARPASEIKAVDPMPYESDQTTHFSVVDADGNAVANTYTLNFSYGVGLVADGTGVLAQQRTRRFRRQARRAQRLWPDRRQGQRTRARASGRCRRWRRR